MGGGGCEMVGFALSLGVYSVVREGAGAAAGCVSSPLEFGCGSYSTYMVVVSEGAETWWYHEGDPAVAVNPTTLRCAP